MAKTQAERDRDYRAANREKVAARRRAKYAKHREKENLYSRAYYAANRERLIARKRENAAKRRPEIREYTREWHRANRVRNRLAYLLASAKQRARRAGLEYSLTPSDLTIPDTCPVLGIPIEIVVGDRCPRDGAPSIDRIDNSLGYIAGNVRVISYRANALKRDMTLDEARLLVQNWGAR